MADYEPGLNSCQRGKCENDFFPFIQTRFYDFLEKVWPARWSVFTSAVLIGLFGLVLNGHWLFALVCLSKQLGFRDDSSIYFKQWFTNVSSSILFGYVIYFPMCGFIQWYFYIHRRDKPEEWKCQPQKFLSWKDEKHEIILGTIILAFSSICSGSLCTYIANGGYSTLYFNFSDYGWLYFWFSIPGVFIYTDVSLYYAHRMMHLPLLYRWVHKMHHRYKQPTPFSATAMHPIEAFTYFTCTFSTIFLFPVHWSVILGNTLYMFYYSIVDHSGVKADSIWPWQPSSTFHDNHHQYFHVNFGFNFSLWDKLHGTYRDKNKIYNENTFYGFGKSFEDASENERNEHFENKKSTNEES